MSQQDVQTIREGYEAFNRNDISDVLGRFDPEIEFHEPGGGRAPKGTFTGPQAVAEKVFSTVPDNFEDFRADPEQFIDAGEHVVVVGRFRGRSKSAVTLDAPFVHVWTVGDGYLQRMRAFTDTALLTRALAKT